MRWDRLPPCSRNPAAAAPPPPSPQGLSPSTHISFSVSLLGKPRHFPTPPCRHCSPPLSEHPSAPFAAQFPVTPSCQVQYLPLAAPMFSEQGVTISLQVSPRFPALTAQLQALGEPLPPSATCPEPPQTPFLLAHVPADDFPGGGDGNPPASQPRAIQHARAGELQPFPPHLGFL